MKVPRRIKESATECVTLDYGPSLGRLALYLATLRRGVEVQFL